LGAKADTRYGFIVLVGVWPPPFNTGSIIPRSSKGDMLADNEFSSGFPLD
jgi:hypothetical protein